jgi:PPK2 family polyphosphate:nucleotide phosphotransferase
MDAAGKDSVIKHVMSGVNPQGCSVYSFNVPSGDELNHDYLWRHIRKLPERRRVGIFNRSYYEEVLAVRVHSELLRTEKIPSSLLGPKIWKRRFEEICGFERYLANNGIVTRKFFLHISKEEQAKRLLERLEEPEKNWRFSISDVHERQHWDDYMDAYEDAIRNTCSPFAPWYVVPADHKWFARLVVASTVIAALEELNLGYPKIDTERRKELEAARSLLLSEQGKLK